MLDDDELASRVWIPIDMYLKTLYPNLSIVAKNLPIYNYHSDPTLKDTDYDGINDKEDKNKLSPHFTGILDKNHDGDSVTCDVDYSFCLKDFFSNNKNYNSDLSTFSVLMSSTVYENSYLIYNDDGEKRSAFNMLKHHGFDEIRNYKLEEGSEEFNIERYNGDLDKDDLNNLDHHISEICIGHQEVSYNGKTKDIVAIVVRGTNGTITEWTSNMDIGSTEERDMFFEDYCKTGKTTTFDYPMNYLYENNRNEFNAFVDWETAENHKGFDIATNRILRYVKAYTDKYVNKSHAAYWITGHSRGAAIANLLSAYLVDDGNEVFTYTFAAPSTTTKSNYNDSKYDCIFNIINSDDFVPMLPTEKWGFHKFGISINYFLSDYSHRYEDLMKRNKKYNKYKYDATLKNTIKKIGNLFDERNDAYKPKSNFITMTNDISNDVSNNALPYYFIIEDSIHKTPDGNYVYGASVTPAFYFQLLASVMVNEEGAIGRFVETIKMEGFRSVTLSLGVAREPIWHGLECPHYLQSYYLLTKLMYTY